MVCVSEGALPSQPMVSVVGRETEKKVRRLEREQAKLGTMHSLTEVGGARCVKWGARDRGW